MICDRCGEEIDISTDWTNMGIAWGPGTYISTGIEIVVEGGLWLDHWICEDCYKDFVAFWKGGE